MTVNSNTLIATTDFDALQELVTDVLGIGENGWGFPSTISRPANPSITIPVEGYVSLLNDINLIHKHITNTNSSTQAVTSSSVISASYFNTLIDTTAWLRDPSRRYTCHPDMFARDPITNTSTFYYDSTSTRTLPWGGNTGVTQIQHKMTTTFPNRLTARYYFNSGCFLTFNPYYEAPSTTLNDLDAAWQNFIDDFYSPGGRRYVYDRQKYVTYDTTTTEWTYEDLYISVKADRSDDQASIDFTITYGNRLIPTLLITPAVGVYTITL